MLSYRFRFFLGVLVLAKLLVISVSDVACAYVADSGWSVMSSRFRLPAGRSYNVRASELARDRQHTEVLCNIILLDNTVHPFKVNVSILAF